jgi:hypothetical protein
LILLPVCFLALIALAHGDVVHLTTGRAIKGTVISETDEHVVVKTPQGKLTLPRHLVERIERQTKGETQLALARERATQGAFDVAIKLYEQAARDSDPKIARTARRELAALRANRRAEPDVVPAPRAKPKPKPKPGGGPANADDSQLPPLSGGEFARTALARQVVLALRAEDGKQASRLLDLGQPHFAEDRSYLYLRARADEFGRRESVPVRGYLALIKGKTTATRSTPLGRLRELARRSLAGEPLSPESPGASARGWKRIETRHFALYHAFERVEPWFAQVPEGALDYVLKILQIKSSEVVFSGRIQVFMFVKKGDYEKSSGTKLAGGHAQIRYAPDGYLKTITLYGGRGQALTTYRHEIAHTVLLELYQRMPMWAHEGAAVYTEALFVRGRYRLSFLGCKKEGTLTDLASFLQGGRPRGKDRAEVHAYYTQASVTFEALCAFLDSPRKTLDLCLRIRAVGAEKALAAVGLTLEELDAACLKMANDRTRDR